MKCDCHAAVHSLLAVASLAVFVAGLWLRGAYWYLTLAGLGSFLLYPALLELLVYAASCVLHSEASYKAVLNQRALKMADKKPVVYHSGYNLTACGLERLHPFDAAKYSR